MIRTLHTSAACMTLSVLLLGFSWQTPVAKAGGPAAGKVAMFLLEWLLDKALDEAFDKLTGRTNTRILANELERVSVALRKVDKKLASAITNLKKELRTGLGINVVYVVSFV